MVQSGRRRFLVGVGAIAAATLARAQRPAKMVRLGVLTQVNTLRTPVWESFFLALSKRGWREGIEYSLEVKEGHGDPTRYLELARELVQQPVDLVLAITTAPAVALKQVSDKIPVVAWCGYPVEAGLAASLARPGGNVTGVASYAGADVWGKFPELLRELKPGLSELGVLWDYFPPAFPDGLVPLPTIKRAAEHFSMRSQTWMVRNQKDLTEALSEVERSPVEALVITAAGTTHINPTARTLIAKLIERRSLAAITDIAGTLFAQTGCILAYSPHVPEVQGRLAHFIDRILRGAHPSELPFELPARYDLAVNAKSARTLGLKIPQSILLRADRVIE
jgi:putative tryptophan/tyrosine transport system substrate-binding protein